MAPCESRGMWRGRIAAIGFCAVPVVALICRGSSPWPTRPGGGSSTPAVWAWCPSCSGSSTSRNRPAGWWPTAASKEAEEIVTYLTGKDIDLSEAAKTVQPKISVLEVLTGMFTRKYIGRTLLLMLLFVCITPAGFLLTTRTTQLLKMLGFSVKESLTAMTIISIGVPVGCFLQLARLRHGRP